MITLKFFVISTLFLPIFMDTLSEWKNQKRFGMENAKSLYDFLFYALQTNESSSMSSDFARSDRADVHNRCEIKDQCRLVAVCEAVEPDPANPDSAYFPKCVELTRCIDSSHEYTKYCRPNITIVNKKVIQHKIDGRGDGIYERLVLKENHTSCRLETKPSKLNHKGISPDTTTRVNTCVDNRCPFYSNDDEMEEAQASCSDGTTFNECCVCEPSL